MPVSFFEIMSGREYKIDILFGVGLIGNNAVSEQISENR